jgi:hypothetical protein
LLIALSVISAIAWTEDNITAVTADSRVEAFTIIQRKIIQ